MAIGKAAVDFGISPVVATAAAARSALERTLGEFTETFDSFSTSAIRRKLKKNADKIVCEFNGACASDEPASASNGKSKVTIIGIEDKAK